MMSEAATEVLNNLKKGLSDIENKIKKAPSYSSSINDFKWMKSIQEAKIEFFKKGYAFRNSEEPEQKELLV